MKFSVAYKIKKDITVYTFIFKLTRSVLSQRFPRASALKNANFSKYCIFLIGKTAT
jgi:hypothetical protein